MPPYQSHVISFLGEGLLPSVAESPLSQLIPVTVSEVDNVDDINFEW